MKKIIALMLTFTALTSGMKLAKNTVITTDAHENNTSIILTEITGKTDASEIIAAVVEKEPDSKIIERENDKPPKRRPGGRRPVQKLEIIVE